MIRLFFCAFLCCATVLGGERCDYSDLLDGVSEFYHRTRLTAAESAEITAKASKETDAYAALEQLFDAYVVARLQEYSGADWKLLKEAVDAMKTEYGTTTPEEFSATEFGLRVPTELKDSLFIPFMKAHEVEHLIQARHWGGQGPVVPLTFLRAVRMIAAANLSSQSRYQSELGAMRAEWEFLQLIPEKLFSELVPDRLGPLPPEIQELFATLKSARKLSVEDYLKLQHQSGRYSRRQTDALTYESFQALTMVGGFTALAGTVGFVVTVTALCKDREYEFKPMRLFCQNLYHEAET